jgi:hypothetical protein
MSPRTVLKVFQKLDITSRNQLRRLPASGWAAATVRVLAGLGDGVDPARRLRAARVSVGFRGTAGGKDSGAEREEVRVGRVRAVGC